MGLPGVPVTDGRRLEVVATGLPLARGVPLGVDVTMVSVLHADGEPWTRTAAIAGAALARAEAAKRDTYPELDGSDVVRLTTLACETGGRWSEVAADTIAQLAVFHARAAPRHLQLSTRLASESRWWALVSCAQQDALAATLVDDGVIVLDGHDAAAPELAELLVDEAHALQ